MVRQEGGMINDDLESLKNRVDLKDQEMQAFEEVLKTLSLETDLEKLKAVNNKRFDKVELEFKTVKETIAMINEKNSRDDVGNAAMRDNSSQLAK